VSQRESRGTVSSVGALFADFVAAIRRRIDDTIRSLNYKGTIESTRRKVRKSNGSTRYSLDHDAVTRLGITVPIFLPRDRDRQFENESDECERDCTCDVIDEDRRSVPERFRMLRDPRGR